MKSLPVNPIGSFPSQYAFWLFYKKIKTPLRGNSSMIHLHIIFKTTFKKKKKTAGGRALLMLIGTGYKSLSK